MADFAMWATAAEEAFGWPAGAFLDAYTGNRSEANDLALEGSPIAGLVRTLADGKGWQGTCADLLARLAEVAGEKVVRAKTWPKTPRALSGLLRRLAPNLRRAGIALEMWREPSGWRQRLVKIHHQNVDAPDRPNRPDCPGSQVSGSASETASDGVPDGSDGSPDGRPPENHCDRTVRTVRTVGSDSVLTAPPGREVFDL
jgi:hypothetical protein